MTDRITPAELAELERMLDACLSLPANAKVTVPSRLLRGAAARVRELEAALRAITNTNEWRDIPIDTPACSRAIFQCREMDYLARAALPEQTP